MLASNCPRTVKQPPQHKLGLAATNGEASQQKTKALFDWRILRTRPALALGLFHLASDIGDFTRHQLAPTMYLEKFKCTPIEMGSWLALGNAMNIPAGFIWATVESLLIRKDVATLTIRRAFEACSSAVEATLFVCYAFAPNPLLATLAYGGITGFDAMHTSGGWANYLEVGGEDTAMLNSVWNTIASSTAIGIPYLGFWLERVTGSWSTMIMIAVFIKTMSGLVFVRWSSTESARAILARADVASKNQ